MAPLDTTSDSTLWRRPAKIAFGLLAVFGSLWIVAQQVANDALRRTEAKVVAQGSSLDPRQIAPAIPLGGDNAHDALESARGWLKSADKKLYRKLHKRLRYVILIGDAEMTAEDVRLFRRGVDHYGPLLDILDSASTIDSARLERDQDRSTFSQLPYLNATEHFADLLAARAQIALAEGRPAAAWRDVRAIFRLAKWSSEEMPILVSQLMAMTAIEVATFEALALLRGTEPDTEEFAAVLTEMRRLDLHAAFEQALEMERAETVTWLLDEKGGPGLIRSWFPGVRSLLSTGPLRPWLMLDLAQYGDAMTKLTADCRRPAFARPAVVGHPGRLEAHYSLPAWAPLTRKMFHQKLVDACNKRDHTLASIDLMELAFRLQQSRLSSGSYPATLEGLGTIPIDPFSGKPYTYRVTASGAILYSFGMDRDDDGGVPHPMLETGLWDRYQGDFVWTLDSPG